MHRYRSNTRCLLVGALAIATTACAIPTPRDNVEAAAQLVRTQSPASLEWRRDSAADRQARERAAALLADGITLDDAIRISFLVNPGLQVELEMLAISRAELVAAVTPPNPVAILGSRKPGGDLAAFYPERNVSIGVLQNVIVLLNIPDRTAVARHDLQRVRYATAQKAVEHSVQVVQAWLEYSAALQIHQLKQPLLIAAGESVAAARSKAAEDASAEAALTEAQTYQLGLTNEAIQSELQVTITRARLGELMGTTGWRDDWQVTEALPPAPASDPDPAALEAAAMQQRFDLLAAAKAVDVRLRSLATQRRFRWLNQLEVGVFREKAIGGTAFTGPNAVVEIPLFDQRRALLMQSDAELRASMRRLEVAQLSARTEIRVHVAELRALRQQLELFGSGEMQPADEAAYVGVLREYWRTRSALALSAGSWSALSGL